MSEIDWSQISWEPLAAQIFGIVSQAMSNYWAIEGIPAFTQDISNQMAQWTAAAAATTDPIKRAEYLGNLADLKADMNIKIASAAIVLNDEARSVLISVLETAINFTLKYVFPLILAAL